MLRGVIFDMDGTLTVPAIDFAEMRRRLGIPEGDILAVIRQWPESRRQRALAIIDEIEEVARVAMEIQPGVEDLLAYLEAQRLPRGIITRNTDKTVRHLLRRLSFSFSAVVTRDFEPVKPAPDAVLHICGQWAVRPAEVLMVGDYRDDILCGKAAGTLTCLVRNARNREYESLAHFAVTDFFQLQARIAGMVGVEAT